MSNDRLVKILQEVRDGHISPDEAALAMRDLPFEDIGFAKVDHHRRLRTGVPEVIFGPGKLPEHLAAIFARLAERGNSVLATRVDDEQAERVRRDFADVEHDHVSRTLILRRQPAPEGKGVIGVVSAGTSDVPVAEEAAKVAELLGNKVERIYDVGVAGLHRLLANQATLEQTRVLVVCAGMEGALPSVVGGLVSAPVIAVPTSIGYGASFGGVAALLGMINSCSSNVTVVNIDNGFGAAYVASLINHL